MIQCDLYASKRIFKPDELGWVLSVGWHEVKLRKYETYRVLKGGVQGDGVTGEPWRFLGKIGEP